MISSVIATHQKIGSGETRRRKGSRKGDVNNVGKDTDRDDGDGMDASGHFLSSHTHANHQHQGSRVQSSKIGSKVSFLVALLSEASYPTFANGCT